MNDNVHHVRIRDLVKTALYLFIGIVLIPVAIGLHYQISLWHMLGLVGSVLILQPMAVVVGLGLGMPPVPIMFIMISFGVFTIFGLFTICDTFAERSAWLRKHLDSVQTIAGKSSLFQRYGIFTLIPFIWIPGVGLYGCVLLAWLFKWRGAKGVGVIMAGWILSTLLVLGASIGIMSSIH
ncbi:MAG: small multi-drug export protein [Methanoregula sp.]|nr:small multi-drug export protein [Methanoregula sp.]MDP2797236.1 small multi-drug export protein [Methanoregula sp.]